MPTPDKRPFTVPRSSICVFPQVLQEYELHTLPDLGEHPVVIDLGANCGAFVWFSLQRWPGAKALAYEPHPGTFKLLKGNLEDLPVKVVQAAVVHPKTKNTARLFEGKNADTECSLRDDIRWPHVSQDLEHSVEVNLADAAELPPCDVLKVDTEGSEVEILTGYKHLCDVEVLLVEAHAVGGDLDGQVKQIVDLADAAGLHAVDVRGTTIRFVRDPGSLKAQTQGGGLLQSVQPAPEGDWAIVETVGGTWRFGRVVKQDGSELTIEPCYEISPSRAFVPIPHPGQGVTITAMDLTYVWGDGGESTVWCSSKKPITRERAGQLLSLRQQQVGAA
jgi:FkbM family methyltransferase